MSEKLIEHFEKEKNYDEVIKIIDEQISNFNKKVLFPAS